MPLAIITGANTGLGFETARGLLQVGFEVVITSRDLERGDKAVTRLRSPSTPNGEISALALDLSNQSSVRAFAPRFTQAHKKCDVLVLNAGAKVLSSYQETDSGIEYHYRRERGWTLCTGC
jgi:NAD(P)-dependent dehydrogenase (short-subunit alcohol dehydrogenase family)